MNKKDREELTELIEEEEGRKWWVPDEFEAYIRSRLPLELTIVAPPPAYLINYNCFVFAFGLEQDPEFLGGNNPVQQEFIKHLFSKNILVATNNPEPGDLVFYKDGGENITHGGIMKSDDIVLSKWMWGAVIKHKLWDVPSSFGDEVFYCKSVDSRETKEEYREYKDSGVEIKPIS